MESETPGDARARKHLLLSLLFAGTLAFCLAPTAAFAGPALEIEQRYSQPDGTTFQASLHGDEHFNYVQTADGHLVQKNKSDQTWSYVVKSGDGFGFGPHANEIAPENALTVSALKDAAGKEAYAVLGDSAYSTVTRYTGNIITLDDIQAAQGSSEANTYDLQTTTQAKTSLPLITIVVGFETGKAPEEEITANGGTWTAAEQRYNDDYDWYKQLYEGEYSISNFYTTMSNGKFTWVPATTEMSQFGVGDNTNVHDRVGDGIIHVKLNRDHGNWEAPALASAAAADMREAYVEALEKASQYIDFSAYDTNGNGVLEQTEACIFFIVAGYEASAGHNAPSTWALQWGLKEMDEKDPNPVTIGDITFNEFLNMGETLYLEEGGIEAQPMSVGTASHELGHYLGLPDLYNTRSSASDENNTESEYPWITYDAVAASLMAGGSWGGWTDEEGKQTFAPTSLDAYCLEMLGYIEPLTVTDDGSYRVSSYWSSEGYQCLKIPTRVEGEYYLVENRQYERFDKGLTSFYRIPYDKEDPAYYNETGGIVVWHVDQSIAEKRGISELADPGLQNTVNTADHRPGVMPVYLEGSPYLDGCPLTYRPFYNADTLAAFDLDSLQLPLYNGCETPVERIASGIALSTTDNASNTMSVTVNRLYEQRALTADLGNVNVEVAGRFLASGDVSVALAALSDKQVAALAKASSQAGTFVFGANVTATDTTGQIADFAGKLSVSFSVDARYEGKALWFAHQKGDGTLEAAKAVVQNGYATMMVDELSPFALFEQKTDSESDAPASLDEESMQQVGAPNASPLASVGDNVGVYATAMLALVAGLALFGSHAHLRSRGNERRTS